MPVYNSMFELADLAQYKLGSKLKMKLSDWLVFCAKGLSSLLYLWIYYLFCISFLMCRCDLFYELKDCRISAVGG